MKFSNVTIKAGQRRRGEFRERVASIEAFRVWNGKREENMPYATGCREAVNILGLFVGLDKLRGPLEQGFRDFLLSLQIKFRLQQRFHVYSTFSSDYYKPNREATSVLDQTTI